MGLIDLISRSRDRWKDAFRQVAASKEENRCREQQIEVLDREFREAQAVIKELYKAKKAMENDLSNRHVREATREQLRLRTIEMREDLDGLESRIATLQGVQDASRTRSWLRGG